MLINYSQHAFKYWIPVISDFHNHFSQQGFPNSIERWLGIFFQWRRMENFVGRGFFYCEVEMQGGVQLTLTKIKISMTCMHKEYEVKKKWCRSKLKMNFWLGYNMKIVTWWWGYFSWWGVMSKFSASGETPPINSQ